MKLRCPKCKYKGTVDEPPENGIEIECDTCGHLWTYNKWNHRFRQCTWAGGIAVMVIMGGAIITSVAGSVYDEKKHKIHRPPQPVKAAPLLKTLADHHKNAPEETTDHYELRIRWTDIKVNYNVQIDKPKSQNPVENVTFILKSSKKDWLNQKDTANEIYHGKFQGLKLAFDEDVKPIVKKCFKGSDKFLEGLRQKRPNPFKNDTAKYKTRIENTEIIGPYKYEYDQIISESCNYPDETKAVVRLDITLL